MLQTGMTVALGVLAVLAQARTPKEICDDIARQNGGRPVPGCVELIESGQKKDEGKEEKKAPPKLEIPKVDFKGLTPGKDDCWAYLEAFEV
ncbi:MAG: hypothetical protein HY553_16185, partial [Elusimicrobia bacterium]|nr:hypothetical protein [Elusimicrobiota bacterium]